MRCTMEKRGQTTLFIILGIVIVILVVLFLVLATTDIGPSLTQNAEDVMNEVDEHIAECMEESSEDLITLIGLQGGYLSPPEGSYKLWDDYPVSYLCYNQVNEPTCINRLLTRADMEEQLEVAMKSQLQGCINVYGIDSSISASSDYTIDVDILQEAVSIVLDYPMSIVKGDQTSSRDTFEISVDAPLGELYDVAMDIVNTEATTGAFDVVYYVVAKQSKYTIYPYKPYPDKLFQVKLREDDYIFQFAVEGEAL